MKALVPGSRIWMCPEAVESQWVYLKQRGDRDFFFLRNCLEAVAMLDQEVREEWQKVDVCLFNFGCAGSSSLCVFSLVVASRDYPLGFSL